MAKKHLENKPKRFVSKRQLSKFQRQKRLNRITLAIGLTVIVAVIAIIGVGFYRTQVQPFTRPALKVNDTTFNMRYYINMLKLYGGQGNLDFTLADFVEQQIEQQELVRQAAKDLGFEVSRSDAEAELKDAGQKAIRELVDVQMMQMVIDRLQEEHFKPQVPPDQPQVNLQAMLFESEEAANQAKTRLESGEEFATVAGELSREAITKAKSGDLGWVARDEIGLLVDSTKLADTAFDAETGKLTGPVFDDTVTKAFGFWVIKVIEKTDANAEAGTPRKVHATGILVGTGQEAADVVSRLESGTDFDSLAKEVSQQPGVKDGLISPDMGSIDFSDDLSEFEKGLFDLPVGEVSGPIGNSASFTSGGYWLVNALEKEDSRPLSDEQMNTLVADMLNKWAEDVTENSENKVENYLTQEDKSFALIRALSDG